MITRRLVLSALPLAITSACVTAPVPYAPLVGFPAAPQTPPLPTGDISRIALTSCANQARRLDLYDQVLTKNPQLVLMLGDNVYGSGNPRDPQLGDLRNAYAGMANAAPFTNLVSRVPTQAIWDDHDFGINDGGGDFAYKALAQAMFNRFWNTPANDIIRRREGIYRAFTLGTPGRRIQFIMLDTRSFRDPIVPTDVRGGVGKERYLPHSLTSSADILGASQWAFLEAELKKPADLRIIASSIQVIADGHGYECWALFPAQRARLYDLIAQTKAKGVVFVSGDRHHGSVNRTLTAGPYPLTDLTASGINMPSRLSTGTTAVDEASTTRLGAGYGPVNFGMLDIDWAARQIKMALHGAAGDVVLSHDINFAEIGV